MIRVNSYNKNAFGSAGAIAESSAFPTPPLRMSDVRERIRYARELRTYEKATLVRELWPGKSSEEIRFSVEQLKYMKAVRFVREAEKRHIAQALELGNSTISIRSVLSSIGNKLKPLLFWK